MTKLRITLDVETQKQLEEAGLLKEQKIRDCNIKADYNEMRTSQKCTYDCFDLLAAKYNLSIDRVRYIVYSTHTEIERPE